jgi:uncharacterized protein (DUF2236 family)
VSAGAALEKVVRVDAQQHAAVLERLLGAHPDPARPLFGPDTQQWKLFRESIVFLGGGRAALLQAAHPFVAQAIADHSATQTDLAGRFHRTFTHVFAMVYGTVEDAVASSKRVFSIHSRIEGTLTESVGRFERGRAYSATDVDALHWVHATLLHSAVQSYELILGEIPLAQKGALYQESKRFAALFGIPDAVLPADWAAFLSYFEDMVNSPTICVGSAAKDICRFMLVPPRRIVQPIWRWYAIMTGALLPPSLRRDFGFSHGPTERAIFDKSVSALRLSYPRVPERFRYLPAYSDAVRALGGQIHPGLYGRFIDRTVRSALRQRRG